MNKKLLAIVLSIISITVCYSRNASMAAQMNEQINIVPQPASIKQSAGRFVITPSTKIVAEDIAVAEARKLINALEPAMGFRLNLIEVSQSMQNCIRLNIESSMKNKLGDEGYTLKVTSQTITISAIKPAGLFYGIQTLRQLLPPAIFNKQKVDEVEWAIPCVNITDYPRFEWRGLLIDPARHFITRENAQQFIDLMALHKLNRLQIHLTDDHGWRIEIKKYPQLTQTGSRMNFTIMHHGGSPKSDWFYTQDDIRKLVRYAADRYITIVPEIEMPAHTGGAIVSYPQVALYPEKLSALAPDKRWTAHEYVIAPRPQTVVFLQDVLTEIMQLFPGKYIHIGGDEANTSHWKQSEEMQELIRKLNLKDEAGLHSWFIQQMDTFLAEHNRRLLGWDEILQGGLAPGATVMSWRGEQGGITAANAGHDVVMAPTSHTYFDYYQGPPEKEPKAIGGFVPLEKVYQYEPVPKAVAPDKVKHILGVQAQLWGEYISTPEHLQYMAYPRGVALAEIAWSPKDSKNYERFLIRLRHHLLRLSVMEVNFRKLD